MSDGPVRADERQARMRAGEREARIRSMMGEHLRFVTRALRRARVPRGELDDSIQRTFIVAAGRLERTPVASERAFLYGVALNIASHARRTYGRRREIPGETPERPDWSASPEDLVERKRTRELVDRILDHMDAPLRAVLILHEIEELNVTEVGAILAIPRGTAASRLRRARAQFRERLATIEPEWEGHAPIPRQTREPALLRNDVVSALAKALLEAGASLVTSAEIRAHTLDVLGFGPA